MVHELKILPGWYNDVKSGIKNFEIRKNDMDFQAGDTLLLKEFDGKSYTGRCIERKISYIFHGTGEYGLEKGYCVLQFASSNTTSNSSKNSNSEKTRYYAVAKGKKTGIFHTWEECKKYTQKFPGAKYKKFATKEEAEEFINSYSDELTSMDEIDTSKPYAFVDGSFDVSTNTYGYGGFIVIGDNKISIQGSGEDKELASMHNVAGEILATKTVINEAIERGLKELTIYYDYEGIKCWALGTWKRKKKGTTDYYKYIQKAKEKIQLEFIHVKGHSGIWGNEEADRLAKEAIIKSRGGTHYANS